MTTTTDEVIATPSARSARRSWWPTVGRADCGADPGAPYTIQLTDGATYSLTIDGSAEDAAATGDLDILSDDDPHLGG